jgi:diguanylate cyclase (GGDEF)-like protein
MRGRVTNEAESLAEAIRRSIERASFGLGNHEVRLTISVGIAGSDGAAALDPEELLSRAEQALRAAKAQGKNRVVVDAVDGVASLDPSGAS